MRHYSLTEQKGKPQVDAITMEKEQHLQEFANKVFAVAENEYQRGAATRNTAKSFLHASVFFEALKHFAPLTEETLGRIRYSKWKATEIVNAIDQGRVPGPEGIAERQLEEEMNGSAPSAASPSPSASYAAKPVGVQPLQPLPSAAAQGYRATPPTSALTNSSDDMDVPDVPIFAPSQVASQRAPSQSSSSNSLPSAYQAPQARASPTLPQQSPSSTPQSNAMAVDSPHQQANGSRAPAEPAHPPRASAGFTQFISSRVSVAARPVSNASSNADVDIILDATKYCKNAISALQFDDPETAVKHLRAALRALTGSDH